jgi:hypothetical protein
VPAFGLAILCMVLAFLAAPAFASAVIPINLVPPSIGGTAQQGHDVVCSQGTWLNSPTSHAYQWKRTGTPILAATSSTYTVQAADVGQLLTCAVTASNADGASLIPAESLPVVPIAPVDTAKPVNLTPPVITGTAQQGNALNCSDGTWLNSPSSYARQWKRDGTAISGATSGAYTVQAADVGHQVTCSVVASNGAGASAESTSLPVVPIGPVDTAKPIALVPPILSGVAQQGRDLSCSDGQWLNGPTSYARRWKRDGTPIAGATGTTHTVVAADVGHQVTCSVVATNGAGDSSESTSLPVVPVSGLAVNVTKPTLYGTGRVGDGLVCTDGTWQPPGDAYTHAWTRDGAAIAGAQGAGYAVTPADLGRSIACTVTARNAAGDSSASSDGVVIQPALGGGANGAGGAGGTGGGSAAAGDRTRPVITAVSLLRKRFAVGAGATAVAAAPSAVAAAARPRKGTAFRFKLSEPARVVVLIARVTDGYRQGRRCVRVTAALRKRLAKGVRGRTAKIRAARLRGLLRKRRCAIQKPVGSLVRNGRAGANTVAFSGRIGRRPLPVGRYAAGIAAGDAAGNVSVWKRTTFEVVPTKPKAKRRR